MKFWGKALLIAAAIFGMAGTSGQALAACTKASLNGNFGVALGGWDAGGLPIAGVYNLKADGNGKITGAGTQNANGVVSAVASMPGTYTVAAGCTGTLKFTRGDSYAIVVFDGNNQFQLAQNATGDGVQGGTAIAMGTETCKLAGLKGAFSSVAPPTNVPPTPTAPATASVMQMNFDGKGGSTGVTYLLSGSNVVTIKTTGTYTVDSHCLIAATNTYSVIVGGNVVSTGTSHTLNVLTTGGTETLGISGDKSGSHITVAQK